MIGRFFRRLWEALTTFWVLTLFITLILIALTWLLGPLVAVADYILLDTVVARLVATICLVFLWGLLVALHYSRKKKQELADPELAQQREREQMGKTRFKEEITAIKDRVKAAIKVVTTSNFYGPKSRSRYALPWYLVLGMTNCGKTSMLLNSGLQFPLNEQADRHLYDLKPTEQPEWLYANQAVFIDTPGKYSECVQDSHVHRLWMTLLKKLFGARPSRPLNGIIVCISMRDLLDSDTARREHLARTLRTRLSEVLKHLRSYVPVYLVFTKTDAVPGFAQFFTHLSRAEREQIFGCPISSEVKADFSTLESGMVRTEVRDLMRTLNAQIIAKIHQERDVNARGEMFQFPQELAKLGPRLEDFLFEAFGPSRYHRPVMFRGFFFSSSLSAHDVLAAAARDGELRFQTGFQTALGDYAKGFFLLRLLQEYVIPEARLAGIDKENIWGLRFRRHGLQLAAAGIFLLLGGFLSISFINNYTRIEGISSVYAAFQEKQREQPKISDAKATLPELDKIEHSTTVYDPKDDSFLGYHLGLYQGKTFDKATNTAYHGTLNNRLLPSLRDRAAEQVDRSLTNVSALKPALQAYIMMCQPKYLKPAFLKSWLADQWSQQYQGQAEVQSSLAHHMDYLLAHGIIPVEPDAALLDRARKALLKIPLAELAYQQMKEEAQEAGSPPFSFRASIGESMSPFDGDTYPIPYLYTREGYEMYLIKRCPVIIANLTEDNWIFGNNPLSLSALDVNRVYKDVRGMYFKDYTNYWTEALQNLSVRTPQTLPDAAKLAEQLTAGISPVVLVLRDLRKHTTLIIENSGEPDPLADAVGDELTRKATQKMAGTVGSRTAKALADKGRSKAEEAAAKALEDAQKDAVGIRQYFVPLDSLLDEAGNPKPLLRAANESMLNASGYFNKLATSDNMEQRVFTAVVDIADEKDMTLRELENNCEKLPVPVRSWYVVVPNGGLNAMMQTASRHINQAYNDKVLSIYNKSLRGYYPFNANTDRDVNLEDFASFFHSGGTLDNFHTAYLVPFINQRGQLKTVMGRTLPISSQAVMQLQRANRVQSAFFASGRDLGINFLLEPYALDAQLKQVTLINEGKNISYWHGPVQGASFSWPKQGGPGNDASLEMVDLNEVHSRKSAKGEWALFRLLQGGTIRSQEGNTCLLEVQQNGKWAQFLVQFRNKVNPFDPTVCSFILPEALR